MKALVITEPDIRAPELILTPVPDVRRPDRRYPGLISIWREKRPDDPWNYHNTYSAPFYTRMKDRWIPGVFPQISGGQG